MPYEVHLRIIASDTLHPVEGVDVEHVLIGDDGGDGGFASDLTNADGNVLLTGIFSPGRYQIYLRPPAGSRFRMTAFTSDETLLTVTKDGSHHPAEYQISALSG